jgi:translation initiation factor 2 alpha subunit (eIF-2alpha)
METKVNELVMCTVKKVEGTTVFVEIDQNKPGSIVFSEIAAGRIRNIRLYVTPGKKIVCKVLKVLPDHLELSLRRVTGKEREEILERYKKEKTFENILKAVTKDSQNIINKIKEDFEIWEFIDKAKEKIDLIDQYIDKKYSEIVKKTLKEKEEKEKSVKKIFTLKTNSEDGLDDIKEILKNDNNNINISYLGSGQFSIIVKAKNFKDAEHIIDKKLEEIEKNSKLKKIQFEVKQK